MTRRMYYRTRWPFPGLYCPLGKLRFTPHIRVFATGCETIPFREIDEQARTINTGTYETAARLLCRYIHRNYGGHVTVRVGEPRFWADATM